MMLKLKVNKRVFSKSKCPFKDSTLRFSEAWTNPRSPSMRSTSARGTRLRDCDIAASGWNQRKGTDCLYVKISIDLIYASIKTVMENCLSYKVSAL